MIVSVGGYQIFPLGDSVDTTRTGKVYYRKLNTRDRTRTKNLQGIMSRNFYGPNYEYRLQLVVTLYEVPQIGSPNPSIVSHRIYLKFVHSSLFQKSFALVNHMYPTFYDFCVFLFFLVKKYGKDMDIKLLWMFPTIFTPYIYIYIYIY